MVSTRIPKQQQQQPIQSQKSQKQQELQPPVRLLQPPIETMAHPPNFQLHFNPPEKLKAQHPNPAPNKRRRRKSRRQRKVQNRLPQKQVLEWTDRIPANHRSSGEGTELLENANNIGFAISLRKSAQIFNNSKLLNEIFDAPKIDADKLKLLKNLAPINVSNSSYDVSAVGVADISHRKENFEHRNEVRWNDSVTYSVTSSITNKYNIDYDNKLEDDFEIIEKDE